MRVQKLGIVCQIIVGLTIWTSCVTVKYFFRIRKHTKFLEFSKSEVLNVLLTLEISYGVCVSVIIFLQIQPRFWSINKMTFWETKSFFQELRNKLYLIYAMLNMSVLVINILNSLIIHFYFKGNLVLILIPWYFQQRNIF